DIQFLVVLQCCIDQCHQVRVFEKLVPANRCSIGAVQRALIACGCVFIFCFGSYFQALACCEHYCRRSNQYPASGCFSSAHCLRFQLLENGLLHVQTLHSENCLLHS